MKSYVLIHVIKHDMDSNSNINYCRKIGLMYLLCTYKLKLFCFHPLSLFLDKNSCQSRFKSFQGNLVRSAEIIRYQHLQRTFLGPRFFFRWQLKKRHYLWWASQTNFDPSYFVRVLVQHFNFTNNFNLCIEVSQYSSFRRS